jgi:hypothetical protein
VSLPCDKGRREPSAYKERAFRDEGVNEEYNSLNLMLDTPTPFLFELTDIAEFEFYLLETLQFYTIVYQPYRPLTSICRDSQLNDHALQSAWQCINDSFLYSDMCLVYPPYLIALASLQVSLVFLPAESGGGGGLNMERFKTWMTGECAAGRVHYKDVCIVVLMG